MAKAPYFPLMVRNILCSRTYATMSGDSAKAFWYLLCESWLQIPRATLPNDDNELASMSRLNRVQWDGIKSDVMRAFKVGTCEEHKGRLYSELLLEISRKFENNQRFNNKNANKSRIKREVNTSVQANANANANGINSQDLIKSGNTNTKGNPNLSDMGDKFETWYTEYPKKQARGDAEKAWKALGPDAELIQTMIEAVKVQRGTDDWMKEGGKFIPLPASWIRQKRWLDKPNDELVPARPRCADDFDPAKAENKAEYERIYQAQKEWDKKYGHLVDDKW